MEIINLFQLTDAGLVPIDWRAATLGELADTSSGTTPARALNDRYYKNGSIPWVKTLDLSNAELYSTTESVTRRALKETSLRVFPPGTVLIAMYGGFQQIGRTGILRIPAAVNQAITAVQLRTDELLPEYLLAALNYRIAYWKSIASSSRKDPNITGQDVRRFPVAFPLQVEQRAIATALGDFNALLGGLDRLIAKKRDLKQAAMQQLLTGQTRLPGFCGQWQNVEFGEVISIRNSKIIASATPVGTQCVELESIGQGSGTLLRSTEASGPISKYNFQTGDLLFGRLRAYLKKYWIATFDGVCSTEIWPFISRDGRVLQSFIHLLVQTNDFLNAAGVSYGTHMPRSDWSVLKKLLMLLPPIPEQSAIAAVLSDMDAELSALEARRKKTRDLKQAMMQELLTGKTRLTKTEPTDA